jgi:topoisomerase-4 subunit A
LTKDKVKQVNLLESLPYVEPEVNSVEVVEEEEITATNSEIENAESTQQKDTTKSKPIKKNEKDSADDDDGQTALF